MLIVVVDGMGGGIGAQLVSQLAGQASAGNEVVCIGANAWATQSMVKAGAVRGATGENAVRVMAQSADIIAGPVGIVIPNALMGEITPCMAEAIASSKARKVLVPVNQGHFEIVGMENRPLVSNIREAAARILELAQGLKD
jgi:NAD(P)-dependent dehydrogenase (short-subunit alcohol dehydrogenase family)